MSAVLRVTHGPRVLGSGPFPGCRTLTSRPGEVLGTARTVALGVLVIDPHSLKRCDRCS